MWQEMGTDSWLERIKVKRSGQHSFDELQASKNRKALYLVVRTWKEQKPENTI